MDLPTYTNIWRIEKRLYKLYDVRLPMPLPINWIAVFAGITIPYVVLLIALGLPFNHTLVWLYVLPPGVLTWLTTRPVIESKRLPELVVSQVRYLTEPRTWVRLAPLGEKEQMTVTARVWHSRRPARRPATGPAKPAGQAMASPARRPRHSPATDAPAPAGRPVPAGGKAAVAGGRPRAAPVARAQGAPGPARALPAASPELTPAAKSPAGPAVKPKPKAPAPPLVTPPAKLPVPAALKEPARPTSEDAPVRVRGGGPAARSLEVSHDGPGQRSVMVVPAAPAPLADHSPRPAAPVADPAEPAVAEPAVAEAPATKAPATKAPAVEVPADAPAAGASAAGTPAAKVPVTGEPAADVPAASAPVLTPGTDRAASAEPAPPPDKAREPGAAPEVPEVPVAVEEAKQRAVPSIERALSGPSRDRNLSWHGKVKIVTGAGAHAGPSARDQEAIDRNRARKPIAEPKRILVLGCTSGAGQTVTTLLAAAMLASLREHPVAAVDLNDGTLARYRAPAAWLDDILAGRPPRQARPARPDGLHPAAKPNPGRMDVIASREPFLDGDEIKLAVQLNRHYPLTLVDPGAMSLPRLLKVADQLVVVVPASAEAAGALADTRDWLDAHGHADLAMQSVTVINGVSRRSLPDVEQAESIARGRSRAIVRVPWDDLLPAAVARPAALRPQTRVAYTALAGVLIAGMATVPMRRKQ